MNKLKKKKPHRLYPNKLCQCNLLLVVVHNQVEIRVSCLDKNQGYSWDIRLLFRTLLTYCERLRVCDGH